MWSEKISCSSYAHCVISVQGYGRHFACITTISVCDAFVGARSRGASVGHRSKRSQLPYALNLRLDDTSSTRIEQVYNQLAGLKVSEQDLVTQYGPCVTILVVTDALSPETLARTVELRLPELDALTVTFSGPCITQGSPPTLGLRVASSDSLLSFHYALYSEFAEDEVHLHYWPAYWQPHLKLCNIRGGQLKADELLAGVAADWLVSSATLDSLEVVRYLPVQAVWQARLKQPSTSRSNNAM